jgi:gas vesicle protein
MTADKDDPNRFRKSLVGGATGAVIGGLTGALASPQGVPKEYVAKLERDLDMFIDFEKKIPEELKARQDAAALRMMNTLAAKPELILEMMTPEVRERLMKKLQGTGRGGFSKARYE